MLRKPRNESELLGIGLGTAPVSGAIRTELEAVVASDETDCSLCSLVECGDISGWKECNCVSLSDDSPSVPVPVPSVARCCASFILRVGKGDNILRGFLDLESLIFFGSGNSAGSALCLGRSTLSESRV